MPPLKHAVFDAVFTVSRGFADLRTFVPVGSHADRDTPEELHNDYDFVYVFDALLWPRFCTLMDRLQDAARSLSQPDHLVYVEPRLGPIKPHGDTAKVSMVQPLVFDRASFADYVVTSPFVTLDWSRFAVPLGLKLTAYGGMGFPSVQQLLDARAGIRHYRQMARDGSVIALTPIDDNGRFGRKREPLPVTPDLLLELYHGSVTRTMANALMVFAHDNSGIKQIALVDAFLRRFPSLERYRPLAAELVREQVALRAGKTPHVSLDAVRTRTIAFLNDLEALCLESVNAKAAGAH